MKTFPLTLNQIQTLATQFPTPFHLYDETAIRDNARRLTRAFSILPGFREFFAVKATPNPFLLRILASEGFGADCSSLAELRLCEAVGITGERIMFTSNETPDEEFRVARDLGAIINLDDITHMDALIAATGSLPKTLCFRYNPGPLKAGNAIIGKPEEAKYGLTREQLFEAYARARDLDVQTFGLHTMVVSNELDEQYHIETARMLFELAVEVKDRLGIRLEFINLSGGIGIPYRPEQEAVDLERSDESLVQPIGHARQPHAVAADQLLVTLEVLPGDRFAPAEDRVAPQGGGLVEPFADQHVVDDHDGAQVPGDAIVAGQDAEEIEQRVEQFSVVRLGGGAVVIDVDRVVLDDRFDRQLEILDGLPPGKPPIQVGEQFEGRLLFFERVEELTGPLLQDRPQVAQVQELLCRRLRIV